MENILHLVLLVFLYSFIWFVPITINYNRRKAGLAPYWKLFVVTLALEIAIIYVVIYAFKELNQSILFACFPPIIASTFAGTFYYYIAKQLDERYS